MFLVLLFLTLLHAVDCPGWQPGTGAITHGGWTERPRAPASCRTHPVTTAVATAAVPAPAPPPPGEAPGTGSPSRPECVYTSTAHEGAPARGDGPGSSLGEGCSPGSGEGPHTAVGGWQYNRYNRGHSRRGTAAPPLTGCGRRGGRRTPPPPRPPPRGKWSLGGSPGTSTACRGADSCGGPASSRHRGVLAPTCGPRSAQRPCSEPRPPASKGRPTRRN